MVISLSQPRVFAITAIASKHRIVCPGLAAALVYLRLALIITMFILEHSSQPLATDGDPMTAEPTYSIHAMELGPMENFVYLLHDHASNRAAIVDPAWEVEEVLTYAREHDIRITDVLLTHSHYDHINGIETVLHQCDAEVHLLKAEAEFWGANLPRPRLHHGGDIIQLGESKIDVMHTPGHTPGSACYLMHDHEHKHLVAGDTLFVFGCGRCDLAGGDPETMFSTLKKMRSELAAETILLPGHNYAPQQPRSTLGEQCAGNPFMHMDNKADFVRYRMQIHDQIRDTPYHAVSKKEALATLG